LSPEIGSATRSLLPAGRDASIKAFELDPQVFSG
jgi:hypothetical protein